MIRVVVVDDHPIVRDGVVASLVDAGGIDVVASVGDAAGALAATARDQPDVVVLDLELSDRSGLAIIADLKRSAPLTRVVVFTAYAGEERVAAAVSSGADSYVLKGASGDELVATVRAAAAGESRMAPEIARTLVGAMRAPRGMRLTEREREILALLAEGLPNRAIAAAVHVTERTVKYHVGEILARLGASNRAQAVAIARRRGLLSAAQDGA
jgi:DNA-binding NarL/FixJ family response regulator